jgi:hypothetical protein
MIRAKCHDRLAMAFRAGPREIDPLFAEILHFCRYLNTGFYFVVFIAEGIQEIWTCFD